MKALLLILLALVVVLPARGEAQFSSDFPGVPRAAITQHGSSQGRFEMDISGMRSVHGVDGETAEEAAVDSLAASVRIGFGRSWRVASNWELGYDVSLAEGRMNWTSLRDEPLDEGQEVHSEENDEETNTVLATSIAYGLRLGVKLRPFAYVDPDGYGISAAVGFAIQPGFAPVITHTRLTDTTFTGGLIGSDGPEAPIEAYVSTQLMAGLSYRSSRAEADAAVVLESAKDGAQLVSPTPVYDGTSIRLGARYRLTRSFAFGAVFWGSGAPPWRDQVALATSPSQGQPFALLFSFGALLEKRTDLMVFSPEGNFTESISLHVRVH